MRIAWWSLMMIGALSAHAVMFKDTGDPAYNTNAPTGTLTNSGWQYQGNWGSYLGTPIAPRYFVVAKHVGDADRVFTLNGFNYHPVAAYDCPNSDLRIWRVTETFPAYAPLSRRRTRWGNRVLFSGVVPSAATR